MGLATVVVWQSGTPALCRPTAAAMGPSLGPLHSRRERMRKAARYERTAGNRLMTGDDLRQSPGDDVRTLSCR